MTIQSALHFTLEDVKLNQVPSHINSKGRLTVFENLKSVPFQSVRVFVVNADEGQTRGRHAHKLGTQLLVCTSGEIEVVCSDGKNERAFVLNSPDQTLLIPAGIWAHQIYKKTNSVLTVFCDRGYDETDYLRDWNQFKIFRDSK